MGYRKIPRIHTLEMDGELEGLIVRVKSISFGKVRSLMRVMDSEDSNGEVMDAVLKTLTEALVSWTLEDEYGNPVPATAQGLESLDFDEVMAISGKWMEVLTGPSPELGKGSSSGGTFPGRPLTMEAL